MCCSHRRSGREGRSQVITSQYWPAHLHQEHLQMEREFRGQSTGFTSNQGCSQKSTKGARGLIKLSTHTHFHRHILCTLDIDNPFCSKERRGKENKGGCTPLLCCFSYNLTSNPLYGTRKYFVWIWLCKFDGLPRKKSKNFNTKGWTMLYRFELLVVWNS